MKGYEKITNPVTGRKVSVYGKTGQSIIGSYINHAQSGGDATPHMGARPARRTQRITQEIMDASRSQLASPSGSGTAVMNGSATPHGHDGGPAPIHAVSAVELSLVGPVAKNLRPRARGTRAERDEGIDKGTPIGPFWPNELDSPMMAEVLQSNTTNKTKDQINFLSEAGQVSQGERDALEEALRLGDGSGFIDFPGLKLLFRGVLYDFLMRDGRIIFQLEKHNDVHSKCQSRGSRRLDGVIRYTKSKGGKLVLTKVELERPNCWPKRLGRENPVSRISL
jgi:hypothetical protein